LGNGELGVAEATGPLGSRRPAALFWQFFTASSISSAGTAVTTVALPLAAVELLHASSFEVSWLTAATYTAWLLIGLPAGVIVQRLPLRGTQVAMDLIRAAALASIPVAAWAGVLSIIQLVLAALIVGMCSVVFDVGNSTFLPFIVSREQLTARNSLMSGSAAVTQLGGPSIGGVLVQLFTAPVALVADVASYLASAALLVSLPRPRQPRPGGDRVSTLSLIKDGCWYVLRHPMIGPCTLCVTIGNFVSGGLLALFPVFLVRTLGAPPWLVGVLFASEGLGTLAGAALTPRLARWAGTARAVVIAESVSAVLALAMPTARDTWGYVVFAFGSAGLASGVVVASVLTRTYRQVAAPPELYPRVMATVRFISWGVIPFGALAAGATASALGNRTALLLLCLLNFGAPISLLASRVRKVRDLADGAPTPGAAPAAS
jgi:MFS family permease